ncbi:uncharacterized protein SCHCODRAFT_02603640 [Schizophyllum commune H4-8]|nr:uncharacterized protein SCHCODRAFT_02603640 [Schizophyllum commune H4-8]KAI5885075.1 hypothetical protein SCHCODRAFT_02603640 [Schizophyllum commune H4-8]
MAHGCPVSGHSGGANLCPVLSNTSSFGEKNPPYAEYDEEALYTNLRVRIDYLTRFVGFDSEDIDALNEIAPVIEPMIPDLVDRVYHQLFKFDVTKRVFMPRKEGTEGRVLADLHHLTLDAPQIQMRKKTFSVYLRKLFASDYEEFSTWQYFDNVGVMHTGKAGLKHRKLMGKDSLHVDIMHLAILLAWTLDILTPVILKNEDFDMDRRIEILRALQKVVWIHNDLFTRHYVQRATHVSALRSASASVGSFSTINEHPPSTRGSSGSSSGGVNESYFPGSAPGDRVSGASPVRRPGTSSSTHSFTSGSSGALGFDKQSQSGKQRKTFFGF